MKLKETACRSLHVLQTHILLLFAALAQRSCSVNVFIRAPSDSQRPSPKKEVPFPLPPCTRPGSGPGTTPDQHCLLSKHLSLELQWSHPVSLPLQLKIFSMLHSSHYQQVLNHPRAEASCLGPKRNYNNNERPNGRPPVWIRATGCAQTFVPFSFFTWLNCMCFCFRQMLLGS